MISLAARAIFTPVPKAKNHLNENRQIFNTNNNLEHPSICYLSLLILCRLAGGIPAIPLRTILAWNWTQNVCDMRTRFILKQLLEVFVDLFPGRSLHLPQTNECRGTVGLRWRIDTDPSAGSFTSAAEVIHLISCKVPVWWVKQVLIILYPLILFPPLKITKLLNSCCHNNPVDFREKDLQEMEQIRQDLQTTKPNSSEE